MKTTKTILLALFAMALINVNAQEYKANTEKSKLEWHAAKVSGKHYGYVDLKSGEFTIKNNKIVDGTFVINMTTIDNQDIESDEWRKKLEDHLRSDDFFSVDKYKTSKLEINESTAFEDGKAAVKGSLTIKGITKPINFFVEKEGNVFTADITLDRTEYDIRYGSGKFFDNLGDNMIYDEFSLKVKLVAEKK